MWAGRRERVKDGVGQEPTEGRTWWMKRAKGLGRRKRVTGKCVEFDPIPIPHEERERERERRHTHTHTNAIACVITCAPLYSVTPLARSAST